MARTLIRIVYFTDKGKLIVNRLQAQGTDIIVEPKSDSASLSDWVAESFSTNIPLVFVGAIGIAVRSIGPFIESKLKDIPVLVIDELGINVIPILSGHYGQANDIALSLANILNANPVITTATDINDVFAVDVFARRNGLLIQEKDKIKEISTGLLNGNQASIRLDINYLGKGNVPRQVRIIDDGPADICLSDKGIGGSLNLIPKRLVLGIGCKRGKSFEALHDFVLYQENFQDLQ